MPLTYVKTFTSNVFPDDEKEMAPFTESIHSIGM